jgi:molybdenum cofactor cytidylyltransferase
MTLHNQPLISFSTQAVKTANFAIRIMVTGRDSEAVAAWADGFYIVHNPRFTDGFGTSLSAGFSVLMTRAEVNGALVMLADMPLITSAHLNKMILAFDQAQGDAVVRAAHGDKPGNPVIMPKALFSKMAALDGEQSGQAIIKSSGLPVISVDIGLAALSDADTPEALAALQEFVL